jgi:dephospho-CoA kinase
VIKNGGSYGDTWRQVSTAWQKTVPATSEPAPIKAATAAQGELTIERGRPRHSREIAALITRLASDQRPRSADDIMAAFGEKAFLLLHLDRRLVGVVGWQVENLVARTTDIYLEPSIAVTDALQPLFKEMERASRDLQCEASLVFVPPALIKNDAVWKSLGYERREPKTLSVQAWQEAAAESTVPGSVLLFKQLRQDRILRPI